MPGMSFGLRRCYFLSPSRANTLPCTHLLPGQGWGCSQLRSGGKDFQAGIGLHDLLPSGTGMAGLGQVFVGLWPPPAFSEAAHFGHPFLPSGALPGSSYHWDVPTDPGEVARLGVRTSPDPSPRLALVLPCWEPG